MHSDRTLPGRRQTLSQLGDVCSQHFRPQYHPTDGWGRGPGVFTGCNSVRSDKNTDISYVSYETSGMQIILQYWYYVWAGSL